MMERNLIIAAVGAAVMIVGGMFSVYQLYKLVETDANCRGLKHPKLWGLFAISGNSQSGLLLYLIGRRKYPITTITDEQRQFMENGKKKIGVGLFFLAIGAIICICTIIIM